MLKSLEHNNKRVQRNETRGSYHNPNSTSALILLKQSNSIDNRRTANSGTSCHEIGITGQLSKYRDNPGFSGTVGNPALCGTAMPVS